MKIAEEFKDLFETDFYMADLCGGRNGMRSFHLSAFALYKLMYYKDFRGFFLRQTHSSIYSSIWQDFKDRVEELQEEGADLSFLTISDNKNGENYARNNITGATIVTKGFKAGSGGQTANLKSLAGATHLLIEEAEEIEYEAFNKLVLSLRKKGVNIQIVRAFNPPPKEHWIWRDYDLHKLTNNDLYKEIRKLSNDSDKDIKGLTDENKLEFLKATPKDERLYITTNYYNNYQNTNERVITKIERSKYSDFLTYCTSILGLITSGSERSVYTNWTKITKEDYAKADGNILYGLDFGHIVPNALIECKFDGEYRYYKLLLYIPDRELPILEALDKLKINKNTLIIADSASRNQISEIRRKGYNIRAVNKSHDANQNAIKSIRDCKVFVCGDELWDEYLGYKYEENKTGELLADQVPMKGNDHALDGIKYAEIGKRYAGIF